MAAFTSTVTEKREKANTFVNNILNVYARTFSYTIPAATASGSTLDAIVIPAGTFVLDIVDQITTGTTLTNSATVAYSLGAGSAIATAAAPATTLRQIGTIVKANGLAGSDTTLRVTTGTGTVDTAATITVTVICANVGSENSVYTTYSV